MPTDEPAPGGLYDHLALQVFRMVADRPALEDIEDNDEWDTAWDKAWAEATDHERLRCRSAAMLVVDELWRWALKENDGDPYTASGWLAGALGESPDDEQKEPDACASRLTAALLATLTACAPTIPHAWQKPNTTPADLARDERQCDYEAMSATAAIIDPFQRGWQQGEVESSCMRARGWEMRAVGGAG